MDKLSIEIPKKNTSLPSLTVIDHEAVHLSTKEAIFALFLLSLARKLSILVTRRRFFHTWFLCYTYNFSKWIITSSPVLLYTSLSFYSQSAKEALHWKAQDLNFHKADHDPSKHLQIGQAGSGAERVAHLTQIPVREPA
ncbi:hypothetical protein OIU85_021814 [Salix viminalis]|uniref:Uncharacterized protein n=1 Tax=Salix viminalis TaxID=40686 RepID=A0A9Q0ZE13_SALVM|nr:hypothetical protein OIU85_021814 [Salix viminalis]